MINIRKPIAGIYVSISLVAAIAYTGITGCRNANEADVARVERIEIGRWSGDPFRIGAEGVVYTNITSRRDVEALEHLADSGEPYDGMLALVGILAELRFIGDDNRVERITILHADGCIAVMGAKHEGEYLPFVNPALNKHVFGILLAAVPDVIADAERKMVELTGTNYFQDVFYKDFYQ